MFSNNRSYYNKEPEQHCMTDHRIKQICGKGGQSHMSGGSKEVGVTIESYGKLEISYINVDNF
jgi:hypothetical protein